MTRDVRKNTQDNKKTGRSSRKAILLDMAPPRQVGVRRLVDWQQLLNRKLEEIMVEGRNIR